MYLSNMKGRKNIYLEGESYMSFKEKAKNWDNDSRKKRSQIIAEKVIEIVGNRQNSTIMEYGCATGLISFHLHDKFKSLLLIDSEQEMIDIVRKKIKNGNISNIISIKKDLTKEIYNEEKFDVIFTSLTLHHIVDIENVIKTFYSMLNKGGILIIFDLDKEDGRFHMDTEGFIGHNGFEHEYIENILSNVGFINIASETFFHGEKKIKNNVIPYSIFYTVGYKR